MEFSTDQVWLILAVTTVLFFITLVSYIKLHKRNQQRLNLIVELNQTKSELAFSTQTLENQRHQKSQIEDKLSLAQLKISELSNIEGQFQQISSQVVSLENALAAKETLLESFRSKLSNLEAKQAELKEQLENEKQSAADKISLLENAKKQMSDEFSVLANKIFEQKQHQFSQSSQATIEATLKPMQGVLNEFKHRVELVHKEDLEGRASLSEQLKQLQLLNSQMTEEAQNLTQALKGDSKTQGNWGELILERLLERSGLSEGVEFEREKSFTDEHGKRLRPDVVVNMPDNKHIIIDSKVSLSDYERALNSEESAIRNKFIKTHLSSLKKHISSLAEKRYEHLEQLNAPDFVLMFIPVEGAYLMAIEADSRVFEDAFEKRVAVVTPTTLFTTLKTIEQLWRYERQSENTVKLIKRAAEVHDKFVGFIDTFEKVGSQFETANNSYLKARKQLVQGNGNLVRQAEMLKDLAGKTKKELPSHLLEEAEGTKLESKES